MRTLKKILLVTLAGLLSFGGISCSRNSRACSKAPVYDTIPEFNGNVDLGQGIANFNLYSLVPQGKDSSLKTRVLEASPTDTQQYANRTLRIFDAHQDGTVDSLEIVEGQFVDAYDSTKLKKAGLQEKFQFIYDGALQVIGEEKRAWEFQHQLQDAVKGIPGVYVAPPIILR